MDKQERAPFATNIFERKILQIVFISSGIPVLLVAGFFYCLFSDLIYGYLDANIADQSVYHLFLLSVIILVYYFVFVGIISYRYIHRLAGTFPRLVSELAERAKKKSRLHIRVRKDDYVKDLVDGINNLLDQFPKS